MYVRERVVVESRVVVSLRRVATTMAGMQAAEALAVPEPPDKFQEAVVSRGSARFVEAGEKRVAHWTRSFAGGVAGDLIGGDVGGL